jgi:hypothetical protein
VRRAALIGAVLGALGCGSGHPGDAAVVVGEAGDASPDSLADGAFDRPARSDGPAAEVAEGASGADGMDAADGGRPGDGGDATGVDGDATGVDGGDGGDATGVDGDDGAPGFVVTPPAVDCAPYAAMVACVLRARPAGGAPTAADGLSWDGAFADAQAAFDRALCGCEVWLAAGTYLPTRSLDQPGDPPDPRNRAFVLWPGVKVYGGFAGAEATREARPATGPETILSGDLGAPVVRDDNAYHVVIGADGALLDGLTVRDGLANGFEPGQGVGGGVLNVGASMTLRNVRVTDNEAGTGGGVYDDARSRANVLGCTFARNTADVGGALITNAAFSVIQQTTFTDNVGVFLGGALAQFGDLLTLTDSHFSGNRSDTGAALALSAGENRLERCWFEGNTAGSFGGAFVVRAGATASVENSVLVANTSVGFGGAIALWTGSAALEATTIVDNGAAFGGAFLVKDGSQLRLDDTVVWRNPDDAGKTVYLDGVGNEVAAATSDVPAEIGGATTFDADPRLANMPLATRFAQLAGTTDTVVVTDAARALAAGDRIELGDDGVERRVVAVDGTTVSFTPAFPVATPRWLRVDHWAADAPSLTLDLTPKPGSPLVDAAGPKAPQADVFDLERADAPDIGALELFHR